MKLLIQLRRISVLCLLISIAINLIAFFSKITYLFIPGLILLSVFLIFNLIFWKCPYCKKHLPMRLNTADDDYVNDIDGNYRCPHCEHELN